MKKCKYAIKYDKTHIKCSKDNSIRKLGKGCPCKAYKESWFTRFINKFF